MRRLLVAVSAAVLLCGSMTSVFAGKPAQDVWRVLEPGQRPADARLGTPRTLNDAYHPWQPPETRTAWEETARQIREQVLVSNGLWPMPPKTPLKPTIYGKIDRGDYTVEKVFFASLPGHYVTGNLYRPAKITGKAPGVLCPHGHWANGRFYDAGEKAAQQQIEIGAEKFLAGASYPLQARMVHLARMGCVVFHYDMVGYADSQQIGHRAGFTDAEAGLRLQNFMGLQTYNSVRALDFLLSLPEVDAERVGVTGASGGGTQTFMLCAVDPRPAVAFPAVMVSTAMQGGCICENADYLRIGVNNIALTALFAPKPQAMSGADDWTIAIESKGLPELRQVYGLYGKSDFVHAKAYPQFKHNYNQVAREMMYDWFNAHLELGQESPIQERDFEPIPPAELSVFDSEHPRPDEAGTADDLRKYLTQLNTEQFAALVPKKAEDVAEYRRVIGAAARVMLDRGVPAKDEVETKLSTASYAKQLKLTKGTLGRKGAGEQVPVVCITPAEFGGTVVLWFHETGKSHLFDEDGNPNPAVAKLLDAGVAVASADLFLTGEFLPENSEAPAPAVNAQYPGYTFGYNRPLVSNRVRDILTTMGGLAHFSDGDSGLKEVKRVHLVGTGDAGRWALLARALAGDHIGQTVVDLGGFSFERIESAADPMYLPGALKYGGIGGLAALAAPAKLTVAGTKGVSDAEKTPLEKVYAYTRGILTLEENELTPDTAVAKLLAAERD